MQGLITHVLRDRAAGLRIARVITGWLAARG